MEETTGRVRKERILFQVFSNFQQSLLECVLKSDKLVWQVVLTQVCLHICV